MSSVSASSYHLRQLDEGGSSSSDVNTDQQHQQQHSVRRLSLLGKLIGYGDPKNVEVKGGNPPIMPWVYPMTHANLPRPIQILALGGDVTWGSTLADGFSEAYPWLVGSPNVNHVDNFALPIEMGAYYSSICLESILSPINDEKKNYDVILLDFISSELEGFSWLLQRLKERYPDAILVYVHLWPLKALIKQNDTGLQTNFLGLDTTIDWEWISEDSSIHNVHPNMSGGTKAEIMKVGGVFYSLPFPNSPKDAIEWFSEDWWHLSAKGHLMVANGILELLSTMQERVFQHKRLGTFGAGDRCHNWLLDGRIPPDVTFSGAEMTELSRSASTPEWTNDQTHSTNHVDVWLLEINPAKDGAIQVENKFTFPVPIIVAYMSNREQAPIFSSVEISVMGQPAVKIDPNYCFSIKHLPKVKYAFVGMANPGNNEVQIKTVTQQATPFQIAGLYLSKGAENAKADAVTAAIYRSDVTKGLDPAPTGRHVIFCFMQTDPSYRVNYTLIEAIIEDTKKRLSPGWTVHVITSGDEAVHRLSALSDVQVVDYRDAAFSHNLARFDNIYIPQSLNVVEYEKYCFYRWIMIREYFSCLKARGVPVEHILALDTDALALENPLHADKTVDWNTIETYRLINGAAAVWSLKGLDSFVDFIFDAYYDKEKAVKIATTSGDTTKCVERRSKLIPCFKDLKGQMVMYHISDMHLYNAWVEESPKMLVQQMHENMECLVVNIHPDQEYRFVRRGSDIILNGDERKVCVIHFMFDSKVYIPDFEAFLHGKSGSSEILLTHKTPS